MRLDLQFAEALLAARAASPYPEKLEFCRATELLPNTRQSYENGHKIPPKEDLENILRRACIPQAHAENVRKAWRKTQLARVGLSPKDLLLPDLSELATRIATEIRFEMKRMGVTMTPRTQAVCKRRIEILLKNSLGGEE